jgi:hypothetical protein
MERTRRTLLFPATYLLLGGGWMLFAPHLGLKLLLSNGEYGDIFPRFTGVLTMGLGLIVVAIYRQRVVALYPVLVQVRVLFCTTYVVLWFMSHDPLFLTLLVMVGTGASLTAFNLARDRRGEPGMTRGS